MEQLIWKLLDEYAKEGSIKQENKVLTLLKDESTEIMINQWNRIFLEDKSGIHQKNETFESLEDAKKQISTFLSICNQRVSIDKPIISFDYHKKYRVHVVHESLCGDIPVITIRRSAEGTFTREYFVDSGFCSETQMQYMIDLVQKRKTIFISGGTNSGKTTLVNFLLNYVSDDERILVIEDTKEIVAKNVKNIIYLRTKEDELGVKGVSVSDLIKSSLRMRPDRIILGEIRRDEVVEFLHAINTGHEGSISTGHGNSAEDMISRLEILLLESQIPLKATKKYLGRGIDTIIQLSSHKRRGIKGIHEVSYENEKVVLRHVL